ncbi:SusC/RagA family TonB-linked outer membrane protein [Ancylomarina euxinus]|uniref:SusC/RagA family TonB-linked outer membrane protein n=1 Tax=Ancylomarina euxinus TaxID=2283627 RepID=A0A425XZ11_9BACT|nr:SusC/RagA family TonB-linked outer membrane protein [Ancylomarina euxinus]MCZ4695582.1 SusC/RagA family TonB-linked outer membrane protein [Ancylomarina euxinus]MUP15963.1 SusC/RagA family TonB-linked outer membrane protein [Ancylomarina euxinus]RRG20405.1 SusC/RagA family TonB-linked outer membrane protein [Ancylomarina euxinus]
MKKKLTIPLSTWDKGKRKRFFMRLGLLKLMLIFGLMSTHANVNSQTIISKLKLEEVELSEALERIEELSSYDFVFNYNDLKGYKVSVDLEETSLENCLDQVLREVPFEYQTKGDVVVISYKKKSAPIQQEKREIKGKVTDENGETLPGVSVVVKGTSTGVATDIDGNYAIQFDHENAVLVFSFVGMVQQEIAYHAQSSLNVVLQYDTANLEEVVVTGYQTISKERATGSFEKVDSKQIEKPVSDISERLVGTVTGLQQVRDPSGDVRFEIRGQSSITTPNVGVSQPLVVVDGFPIEGDFKTVNPNDIESVTILKDAAATSIWGARSANGVIVITTKKGSTKNKAKVEFSSFWKFKNKPNLRKTLNRLSSADQIELEKYVYTTENNYGERGYIPYYSSISDNNGHVAMGDLSAGQLAFNEHYLGKITLQERDNRLSALSKLDNTKQIEKYLLQQNFTQQYNLAVSGGNDKMNNRLSLMFEDRKGDNKNNDLKKYMVNYKLNYKILKNLDFSFNGTLNYNNEEYNGSGSKIYNSYSPVAYAKGVAPYQMLKNADGSLARWSNGVMTKWGISGSSTTIYGPNFARYIAPIKDKFPYQDWTFNPIEEINARDFNARDINARFQAGLNFKIIKGLDLSSKFQYEIYDQRINERYFENSFEVRMRVNATSGWDKYTNEVTQRLPKGEFLDKADTEIKSYNFRNQLNFHRDFGKHSISALVGTEVSEKTTNIWAQPRGYGYDNNRLSSASLLHGDGSDRSFITALQMRLGIIPEPVTSPYPTIIGRQAYGLLFGFRTTALPGYSQEVYFSMYSNLAYTYDEKFTLTASARTDASNFIADDPKYRYSPFWSIGGIWHISKEMFMEDLNWIDRLAIRTSYGVNGNANKGSSAKTVLNVKPLSNSYTGGLESEIVNGYGNPDLGWEKVNTFNLGLDYSLFNGKLFGKVEFYNKNSKDLICRVSVPRYSGANLANLNAAEMYNRGLEMEFGTNISILKDDIVWSGNLSFAYNKNKITNVLAEPTGVNDLVNGGYFAYASGYDANALWTRRYAGLVNDEPMIYDSKNTKHSAVDTWNLTGTPFDYSVYSGTKRAPYVLGFNSNFKIYDFDISFILTGKFGHKFMREAYDFYLPVTNTSVSSLYKEAISVDPDKQMPMPTQGYNTQLGNYPLAQNKMNYLVENASHIRFQEISVTYNMPHTMISKLGLDACKLYSQVNNIGTILFNDYNEDPEYGFNKPTAVFTFGLKCNF